MRLLFHAPTDFQNPLQLSFAYFHLLFNLFDQRPPAAISPVFGRE
jgi:hypothetical protein